MRIAAVLCVLVGLAGGVTVGQERRGNDRGQGIPQGHLPPPGECRVWFDGRPAGQQPPPTSCRVAERVAARTRNARVIYGDDSRGPDDERWSERDDDRGEGGRAIPRGVPSSERQGPIPDRYPNERGWSEVPFNAGWDDGFNKGRDDAREGDSYDPVRHSWYRSAERGYDPQYGSRDQYKSVYRDGFRTGYEDGYRHANTDTREGGTRRQRSPWVF